MYGGERYINICYIGGFRQNQTFERGVDTKEKARQRTPHGERARDGGARETSEGGATAGSRGAEVSFCGSLTLQVSYSCYHSERSKNVGHYCLLVINLSYLLRVIRFGSFASPSFGKVQTLLSAGVLNIFL